MAIFKNRYKNSSDEKLMKYIQKGDVSAFNVLYDRYSQCLLFYFHRMLGGDQDKAQDFLQEIFLKIVEKPELFHPEKRFSTWIFTVAYNLCKNEYRHLEKRKEVENRSEMNVMPKNYLRNNPQPDQILDQKDFKDKLFAEVEKFDEDHRSVFLLRYQQNFGLKEISEILGCPEGTVKSRLFYTTKKLAEKLKAYNPYNKEVKANEKPK